MDLFKKQILRCFLLAWMCVSATAHGSAQKIQKTNSHDRLTYVWIRPGSYITGCDPTDTECIGWERPRQTVLIRKGFWVGQTEVTQAAYAKVMGSDPSRYKGPLRPVEQVNWISAKTYCNKISMRLPTESEWEFAAAAGLPAPRYGPINDIAWFDGNSADQTHPVAQKLPNAYGLYDMLGNVWEWVDQTASFDPKRSIMKGGSFYNLSRDLRVPNRETPLEDLRHRNVGFRCAANALP